MDVTLQTARPPLAARDVGQGVSSAEAIVEGGAGTPGNSGDYGVARVTPAAKADETRTETGRQGAGNDTEPGQPAKAPSGITSGRYQYRLAFEPDLQRMLLKIVDEKTDQTVVSLPPEQLARMLQELKAPLEAKPDEVAVQRLKKLDTSA